MNDVKNRCLLILAPAFPPKLAAAIFRILRFCRDLPDTGWDCRVLATRETCANQNAPLSLIPETTQVERFPCRNILEHLRMVTEDMSVSPVKRLPARAIQRMLTTWAPIDLFAWTVPALIRATKRTLRKTPADAILISLPPFSWALAIKRIRKFSNVPIILDFRDAWSSNEALTARQMQHARKHEREVLAQADGAIFNTPGAMAYYQTTYPELDQRHWRMITNGFSREQIDAIPAEIFTKRTLVYGGVGRNTQMELLAKALGQLKADGLIAADNFEFIAYGQPGTQVRETIATLGVGDLMTFRGSCSQQEVIASLKGAAGLILLVLMEHAKHIPGKLYEYIATGKTTLMIGPGDSDPASILQQTHSGWCVDPTTEAIIDGIRKMLAGNATTPNPDAVEQYESKVLSRKLADLLDNITREKN